MDDTLAIRYTFEPAVITADFDGMREKLDELLAPYQNLTADMVAEMDIKEAKSCRADLNAISNNLNDARKAIKKQYNEPLAEFEAKVKELDAVIQEPKRLLDEGIKRREEQEKQARYDALKSAYEDYGGPLVSVVEFDQVLNPQWLNKSYGEKKAENELCDKVADIAKSREVLLGSNLKCPDETMAEFYRTLDIGAALAYDKAHAEELERIASIDAEIDEIHAYQESEPSIYDIGRYRITIPCQSFQAPTREFMSLIGQMNSMGLYPEVNYTISLETTEIETVEGDFQALINHLKLLGIKGSKKKLQEEQNGE